MMWRQTVRIATLVAAVVLVVAADGCVAVPSDSASLGPTGSSLALPAGSQMCSVASADLDGVGSPETVALVGYGGSTERLGYDWLELLVFGETTAKSQVVWRSGRLAGDRSEPLQLRDLNQDGRPEVLCIQALGAAGETLQVFGWLGQSYGAYAPHGGHFDGLACFGDDGVRIEDLDGDGLVEIIAHYGPAASQGDVYRWDGKSYVYSETLKSE